MILAFTGAGISRASGIPTFEEQPDLRTCLDRSYARRHPASFNTMMEKLRATCLAASPNPAHMALARYKIPTITMNIDGLHERAIRDISDNLNSLLEIHGSVCKNNVVLYGDTAPNYVTAEDWIRRLRTEDILLVVGTSCSTKISERLITLARKLGAHVVEINSDAEHAVEAFLEIHKGIIETFETFNQRELMF